MARLPDRPDFAALEQEANELLHLRLLGNPAFTLEDAQMSIAREYGLPNWQALRNNVDWRNTRFSTAREHAVPYWLHAVYGHQEDPPKPEAAARTLAEQRDFVQSDLFLACAAGEENIVRDAVAADPACVNRMPEGWVCPGCKNMIAMPPLVAVTHSTLLRIPKYRDRLRSCARILLDAGADPNQSYMENDHPLSALYGAAGKNHDVELTRMLLAAGANPNDGESLYHSLETLDNTCTRLLLEAGARVDGSNALHHCLDTDRIELLRLLLSHTKDANDLDSGIGRPLLWAIRRRRDRAHIEALLAAGADPRAKSNDGISAYKLAMQMGLTDVAQALAEAGAAEGISIEDQFVAACARVDETEACRILTMRPDILASLSEVQLKQLPQLVEVHNFDAVRLMVRLGWPIAVRGGDWGASALNHAVYQGNPGLTRFLLEHGASWTEQNNFGGAVNGILAWASRNQPPESGDWVGCAHALIDHGMPILELDGQYSDEVERFLAAERARLSKKQE